MFFGAVWLRKISLRVGRDRDCIFTARRLNLLTLYVKFGGLNFCSEFVDFRRFEKRKI